MAGTPVLKNVWRPVIRSIDPDTLAETLSNAAYLMVRLDRYNNGMEANVIKLLFSDYAGLQAEWEAGSATTVLDASITAAIASADWIGETLTSPQRALLNNEYTES